MTDDVVKRPRRHGEPWLPDEEQKLREAFLEGASIEDLAHSHERGVGGIRSRLERLGLIEPDDAPRPPAAASVVPVQDPEDASPAPARQTRALPISDSIDHLVSRLLALKAEAELGVPGKQTVAEVARASERFDTALLSVIVHEPQTEAPDDADDPLPDRLRAALRAAVCACVRNTRDRYVANRVLGLEGDGERATLASVGAEFGVTRERVRQLRVRAFRRIDSTLPRRIATAARLRGVLAAIAADADWTDPAQAAQTVVKLVTDRFAPAKQLTLMLCRASGAADPLPQLRRAAEEAAAQACRNPDIHGCWRFDRWSDAAIKAIFAGLPARFDTPPQDMISMKRMPEESRTGDALAFSSKKLSRTVACESGMEMRVFSWLERSPEVLWYQEQPVALPYSMGERDRLYYPDVAVLDREGRLIVVEVKPVFRMYRLETAAKAVAALAHLGPRGAGYLLVDSSGRTLADLAYTPYDPNLAEEVEALFAQGPAPFRAAKEIIVRRTGRLDLAMFVSMVVNRNWAVDGTPVSLSKLPAGISFRPLIAPL